MCNKHDKCCDPPSLEGKYANYFKIGHNSFEFVMDFGQAYDEDQEPQLHTRIIASPVYAKAFLETLQDSVEQYEKDCVNTTDND